MVLGLIHLFLIFFLTSCGGGLLRTLTPTTNLLTSEVQGRFLKTSIAGTASDGVDTSAPINDETTSLNFDSKKSFTQVALSPQVGISSRVDIFTKIGSHSPILYGVKWQMFGTPKELAMRNSNSFSIYMSGGRNRYQAQWESNFPSTSFFKANRIHTLIDYGFLFGRRLLDELLLYSRYSALIDETHGKFDYEDNPNLDQTKFSLEGKHRSLGLGLLWHSPKVNIGLEYSQLKTNWKSASNTTSDSILFILSRDFD